MLPSDFPAFLALWTATAGMGRLDDTPAGPGRFLAHNPATCFVAKEDGAPTGAILSGHDGRRGSIGHTALVPSRRRAGWAAPW